MEEREIRIVIDSLIAQRKIFLDANGEMDNSEGAESPYDQVLNWDLDEFQSAAFEAGGICALNDLLWELDQSGEEPCKPQSEQMLIRISELADRDRTEKALKAVGLIPKWICDDTLLSAESNYDTATDALSDADIEFNTTPAIHRITLQSAETQSNPQKPKAIRRNPKQSAET